MKKEMKTNSRIRSQEKIGKIFEPAILSEMSLKAHSIVEISRFVLEVGSSSEKEMEIIHDYAVNIIDELNSPSLQTIFLTETNAEADAVNIGSMEELSKVMLTNNYTPISEEIHPTRLDYRNSAARFIDYCKENFRKFLFTNGEGK